MEAILSGLGGYWICIGREREPANNAPIAEKTDYKKRKATALRILTYSVSTALYSNIRDAAREQNPAGV